MAVVVEVLQAFEDLLQNRGYRHLVQHAPLHTN